MAEMIPPQDRTERLADRVLAVAKSIASQGDGRTFTADAVYAEMSDINKQRLKDAIKTLKDARRIHAIGASTGAYEIEESFPAPRNVATTTLSDGWRLIEVGDVLSMAITPQEAAILGSYLAGDAVRVSLMEEMRLIKSTLSQVLYENSQLKQEIRSRNKAAVAQSALPL